MTEPMRDRLLVACQPAGWGAVPARLRHDYVWEAS